MQAAVRELPAKLVVKPWVDADVERSGFNPLSDYVELCWLPVLGPSATWLYRRLGTCAIGYPHGGEIDTAEIAASLGLGTGLGRHSLMAKAIARLCRFGLARWAGDELHVRRVVEAVPPGQLARLGDSVQRIHASQVSSAPTPPFRSPRFPDLAPASRPTFSGYL